MVLENKLGITNPTELNQREERLSKQKAVLLFQSGELYRLPLGTFKSLAYIHQTLFEDIYAFAGQLRTVNVAKGNFRFAPVMYLQQALGAIDAMPHHDFDTIMAKYVEMNVAHPFREGNGRAMRLWLDAMLKQALAKAVNWHAVGKEAYLSAMERSPINPLEIKTLLQQALSSEVEDTAFFMKGLDASYHYEGYTTYKSEDL